MGVFQKEMGEALKLQYFKSARMWPGMTVQRVQMGAKLIETLSHDQKKFQEGLKLTSKMKTAMEEVLDETIAVLPDEYEHFGTKLTDMGAHGSDNPQFEKRYE